MTRRLLLPGCPSVLMIVALTAAVGCGGAAPDTSLPPQTQRVGSELERLAPRTPILIQSGSADVISDGDLTCQGAACTFDGEQGAAIVHIVSVRAGGGSGERVETDLDTGAPGPRSVKLWFGNAQPDPNRPDLHLDAAETAWTLRLAGDVSCTPGTGGPGRRHSCNKTTAPGQTRIGHYARGNGSPIAVKHVAVLVLK